MGPITLQEKMQHLSWVSLICSYLNTNVQILKYSWDTFWEEKLMEKEWVQQYVSLKPQQRSNSGWCIAEQNSNAFPYKVTDLSKQQKLFTPFQPFKTHAFRHCELLQFLIHYLRKKKNYQSTFPNLSIWSHFRDPLGLIFTIHVWEKTKKLLPFS